MSHVEASVLFFCEASHHKAPQLRWKKTTGGVHGITRCKAGAGLPRWKALSLNAAPAWISHCVCTLGIHNESKQGHGKSKEAKLTMVCYAPQSLAEACASHLGHPRSIALIWFSQQADSTCVSCISFSASSSATYATSDSFSFSRRCCSHDQAPVAVQQQAARRLFDRPDAPRRWLVTEPHLATHATRGDVLPLSAQEEILERFDIHSKTLFEYAPHERLGDQWETVPPRLLGLGHEGSPHVAENLVEPEVHGRPDALQHLSPCPLEQVLGDDRPLDRRGRGLRKTCVTLHIPCLRCLSTL